MYDIVIIGGGPAGTSAAITACVRGKRTAIISNHPSGSNLYKAERVDNYPGMPDVTGAQLSDAMLAHARSLGTEIISAKVQTVMPSGDSVWVGYGQEMLSARCVILAPGLAQGAAFPGEKEFLGRGVSYCGTCDAMLYCGKHVAVIAQGPESVREANFLMSVCASVTYFGKADEALDARITLCDLKPESITGDVKVTHLRASGEDMPFEGVFIFREAMALSALLPGLEMNGVFIGVDRQMRTSIPGVFAAGDCTGLPLQVAKAVGEGCIAALCAAQEL